MTDKKQPRTAEEIAQKYCADEQPILRASVIACMNEYADQQTAALREELNKVKEMAEALNKSNWQKNDELEAIKKERATILEELNILKNGK